MTRRVRDKWLREHKARWFSIETVASERDKNTDPIVALIVDWDDEVAILQYSRDEAEPVYTELWFWSNIVSLCPTEAP